MYWMHGFDGADPAGSLDQLCSAGFEAVVSGYDPAWLARVADRGLAAYACSGTFSATGRFADPSYLAIDLYGQARTWFGSTCPSKPDVRRHNIDALAVWAANKNVTGIMLDGARFASPASDENPLAFFTCFCADCHKRATAWDFDFARMRRDVRRLHQLIAGEATGPAWPSCPAGALDWLAFLQQLPGVLDWLDFRRRCTSEHISDVSRAIKQVRSDIVMGLYLFTPTLAPLVGQSYADLASVVDVFAPMIYRSYPAASGPACLNKELACMARELSFAGRRSDAWIAGLLSSWTGYDAAWLQSSGQIDSGLPVRSVAIETAKARSLVKRRLVPIIQLDDPAVTDSVAAALESGADGVNFFLYDRRLVDNLISSGLTPAATV